MTNPYIEYYTTQAGTGIAGFQGSRYQRGHGFFGRILSKAIYPLLRFLGKKAVGVGADLASDIIVDKKDWKEAAKHRLDQAATDVVKVGVKKAKEFSGSGKRRKKVAKVKELIGGGGKKTIKIKSKRQRTTAKAKKKSIKRKKRKPKPSNLLF